MPPTFQCPNVLRDCDCLENPVRNFTSEREDVPVFLCSFRQAATSGSFFAPECVGACESTLSLEDCEECAQRASYDCPPPPPPPRRPDDPNDPPPPPPPFINATYLNNEQTCIVECPDGSTFSWVVPAGTIKSFWQADADARAYGLACKRATKNRLCFTTASALPSVCVNETMSVVFDTVGGTEPITFAVTSGTIPSGMEMNEQGNLFGSAVSGGYHTFEVTATDAIGSTQTKEFTLNIVEITSPSALPSATQGSPYSYTLLANGYTGTPTWTLISGSLPAGLTRTGAIIQGTPTEAGDFAFTMQIADTQGAVCQKAHTLHVAETPEPSFYWTFDNTLDDSIVTLPMTAGLVNYGTGRINNGFRFIPSINSEIDAGTGATASIPYTAGQHLSFSWWMNWAAGFDANDQIQVRFEGGGNSVTVTWLNAALVRFRISNGVDSDFVDVPFVLGLGAWRFFAVAYNADTGLADFYIDGALAASLTSPVLLNASGTNSITFRQIGGFGGTTLDFVVDESGWWFDTNFNAAQVAFLYNGGAGERPPGV